MKKVPYYWWDFEGNNAIIVESDCDKFPVVGRFYYNPKDGLGRAAGAILKAEALIVELNAGRVTPHNIDISRKK